MVLTIEAIMIDARSQPNPSDGSVGASPSHAIALIAIPKAVASGATTYGMPRQSAPSHGDVGARLAWISSIHEKRPKSA